MRPRSSLIEPDIGLTFDDVLLIPGGSEVLPGETNVASRVTKEISVNIPILSSAMDTVTEGRLAIAVAQAGGIGVVHRNLQPAEQAEQVAKVKKFESGMVVNPDHHPPDGNAGRRLRIDEGPQDLRHSGRGACPQRPPEGQAGRHSHQP